MRGITYNLDELTDSREMMEHKEPPGIRYFLWLLLAIIGAALVFGFTFRVNDYVRATGTIKTSEITSGVVSLTSLMPTHQPMPSFNRKRMESFRTCRLVLAIPDKDPMNFS